MSDNKIKFDEFFDEEFVNKINLLCQKIDNIEKAVTLLVANDTLVDFLKGADENDGTVKKRKSFDENLQDIFKVGDLYRTYFQRKDGKYQTTDGFEITNELLMNNPHEITGEGGWIDTSHRLYVMKSSCMNL